MISAGTPRAPLTRRWWLTAVIIFGLLLAAGWARAGLEPSVPTAAVPTTATAPATPSASAIKPTAVAVAEGPVALPAPASSAGRAAVAVAKDPVALPGAVPAKGTGTFGYAAGRGPVFGTGGPLRRFRVAVERGSREDVAGFAARVQATLGDPRSWTGGGRLRLQRVSGSDRADFTVYLATRETAGRMCARGGVNIRVGGRPYTSCRATGQAIINLDRWRLSASPYLQAGVPLGVYRQYVINHEVGHELGHSHQGCPRRGGPAPVMVQQTLTLRGCTPYAWPRRGDRDLTGPGL